MTACGDEGERAGSDYGSAASWVPHAVITAAAFGFIVLANKNGTP